MLGRVEATEPDAVPGVVARARAAADGWARMPIGERAALLELAATALDPRADELAALLAAESGKPIAQASFEVRGAIALLRANAAAGRRSAGRVLPTEGNPGTERDLAFTRREPLGVVAAILPFNFPAELFVEKCAAALVAGNAVVAKPPLEDPLTVVALAEALWSAGVPADVLALVHGGSDVGAALAQDGGVDAVSLTGSTGAGLSVARAAAAHLRRLHLELGGNNACLVLDDADLELARDEIAFGRLMMNGQACSATKRVLVDRRHHDRLAEMLSEVVDSQVLGPATDPATTIGPLITETAAERVAAQIARAIGEGGRLVVGGDRPQGPWLTPALLTGVPTSAAIARDDEVFGPVLTLIPVDGEEQAVAVANASSFGLMASVFTADWARGLAVAERLEAGGVVVNGSDNYRPPVIPFGGVKLSGAGREGIGYTIEELSREKTIVMRRMRPDAGSR